MSLRRFVRESAFRLARQDLALFLEDHEEHLLHILSGQTADVIQTLEHLAQDPSRSSSKRESVNATVGYYRRHLPYMCYDQCLARG